MSCGCGSWRCPQRRLLLLSLLLPTPLISIQEQKRAAEAQAAGEWSAASEHLARAAACSPPNRSCGSRPGVGPGRRAGREGYRDPGTGPPGSDDGRDDGFGTGLRGKPATCRPRRRSGRQPSTGLVPRVQVLDPLSLAYLRLGSYHGARSALELLLLLKPEDAVPQYRLGLLLAAVDPEAAVEHLEEALACRVGRSRPLSCGRKSWLPAWRAIKLIHC